ncbi:MAG: PA1571 family protein [Pseudomonas sp.]|uniref:PA1571 family protein n=1 Tax=Pseudomonas sp. TaxID=306 RepID=UPI003D12E298
MNTQNQTPESTLTPQQAQQPVGGAIIDAEGREIPITETMIQQACNELECQTETPARRAD